MRIQPEQPPSEPTGSTQSPHGWWPQKLNRAPLISLLALLAAVTLLPQIGIGQPPVQQDIYDWLLQKKWIKKKPEKKGFLLVIPIIASNPTAGIIFGAGLTYAYTSKPQGTKTSTITSNATYSTKGLLNCNIKSNAFIYNDRIVLNGDWRYLINNESTYGLGSPPLTDSLGQELEYAQIRIHETASWQLFPNFFAGIGFQFDRRFDIKDQTALAGDSLKSYHYQYSALHGFHTDAYVSSGVGINVLYDSRDNQVNAYRGYYANINYLLNVPWLGSTQPGSLLLTEYRSYHTFSNKRNGHLLAFWLYGHFQVSGHAPYLALPYNGNDQRQKTARGYPFGAFRGEKLLIAETEYRYPISRNTGILGGVVFLNATSTSNQHAGIGLLEYIRPGYGAGLRIMLEKRSRTRLEIDAAIDGKRAGFYFGVQETF
jgi:outer membrane protein assembly factor BamA